MKKLIIIMVLTGLFISCNKVSKENVLIEKSKAKKIRLNNIVLDTIILDKIQSSYFGFLTINNDTLQFVDSRFCWVFLFDKNGKFIKRVLGQGKGPKEISTGVIDSYVTLEDGRHLFVGSSWDCHIFSKHWIRLQEYRINWQIKHTKEEMLSNPKPDMPGLYTLMYDKLEIRIKDNYAYLPIESQHPKFNMANSRNYYENARILAKMDINTGAITELIGRRSEEYSKYSFIPQFSYFSFDIAGQDFFCVSFEPDSLIYKYDKNMELLSIFGFNGTEMDKNYIETNSIPAVQKIYKKERNTKGYYTWIEYFDQHDLLFRAYQKGAHTQNDGLQIYQHGILIADVNVPKGMNIEGYIEPYYYSNAIIDEMNETMKVYRFKLDL